MARDSLFDAMGFDEFIHRSGGEFITIRIPVDKGTSPKIKENMKGVIELAAKAGWVAFLFLGDPTSSKVLKKEAKSFIAHIDRMNEIAVKGIEKDPGTQEAHRRKLDQASKSFLEGEEIEE